MVGIEAQIGLLAFLFIPISEICRVNKPIMNRSFYIAPVCATFQIEIESALLNGSNDTIDNPGIGGPGDIWFE